MGTTSACAENTLVKQQGLSLAGNYLRVRGEYAFAALAAGIAPELPPRARRILTATVPMPRPLGTTSACAENTQQRLASRSRSWNYLRVRGEYFLPAVLICTVAELPPRARRIHCADFYQRVQDGTTSACAENT